MHSTLEQFQKLFISGYMSKRGHDFNGLGFYLIDKDNKIVQAEDYIDVGDLGIGFATVQHGVAPVNTNIKPSWNNMEDGRWFLSMYSNQSDEVQKRHTGYSISNKINIADAENYQIKPA